MLSDLWAALALVLVIEGLLPALSPRTYRKMAIAMMQMDERSIRTTGLVSMIAGALFLYLVKH
jgi:uncharacterized protein YjeT (DUF2065 family)